jgi:hypothetical protein
VFTTDRLGVVPLPPFELTSGVDAARLRSLSPEMLDLSPHRVAQKQRFGGEFFPNIVEGGSGREFAVFFQFDRDGTSKGIVVVDPSKEIWE